MSNSESPSSTEMPVSDNRALCVVHATEDYRRLEVVLSPLGEAVLQAMTHRKPGLSELFIEGITEAFGAGDIRLGVMGGDTVSELRGQVAALSKQLEELKLSISDAETQEQSFDHDNSYDESNRLDQGQSFRDTSGDA
ncbi:uncharacterized protein PFL1_06244 [Pseudozyma flocculosa PF-1]|nr:uncharacterized protein PFL1_06244 [Pseudozyma flocculosa PF-1]EPQ26309.1 hypothetical protein PFL1_06244 [Pseudozyma flocculosa PF-1]